MALILGFSLDEQAGCRALDVIETTGVYDATTNPGGFGAPNDTSASITQVIFNVYPEGYTTPIRFDLTLVAGVVTALDITRPGQTAVSFPLTDVNTAYPWTAALPFTITGEMITGVADDEITYGAYNIDYFVYISQVLTAETNLEGLITCQVDRAVKNAQGALDVDCACDCSDAAFNSAYKSSIFLQSAKYSMANAEPIKAVVKFIFPTRFTTVGVI